MTCVFAVNATLEAESDLYQLSYLSLPIHTSAPPKLELGWTRTVIVLYNNNVVEYGEN
jgi:hypothetical protein